MVDVLEGSFVRQGALLVPGSQSSVFDPGTLSLTGWWRASYAGPPWLARASAGTSGANGNLVTAGSDPSVGTPVNGLDPADFNGAGNYLTNGTNNDVFFSGTGSAVFLFNADGPLPVASGTDYADGNLLTDPTNAETTFGITSAGFGACIYSGAYVRLNTACSSGSWHLGQAKWDGVNLKVRVDGGSWSSTACGSWSMVGPGPVRVGLSYGAPIYFDGKLLEVMLADSALSDSDFNSIKSYINIRYGLAL